MIGSPTSWALDRSKLFEMIANLVSLSAIIVHVSHATVRGTQFAKNNFFSRTTKQLFVVVVDVLIMEVNHLDLIIILGC